MARKRGLGKGLDALLAGANLPAQPVNNDAGKEEAVSESVSEVVGEGELKHVPVEFLQRGRYQPRKDIDPQALEELSESIKAQGLMQPIVVRPIGEKQYEIIAGERRWRASQLAQLDTIPCLIKNVPDEAAIAMALIENIQREDLNPMEEAVALQRLQDEFELTHQQVAEAVGKSRTTITNLLRLNSLNGDVKKLLEHGDLEMGHARTLLSLQGEQQSEAARSVVARGLSVRQTEALVRNIQQQKEKKPKEKIDPDVRKLQDSLAAKLGAPVQIDHTAKGKGKLVIKYNSLDELDGILNHIK